jgi:hypothetical protein
MRKAMRKAMRELTKAAKAVPCMDCGNEYPYYVLDFDHREPAVKKHNISRLSRFPSLKALQEEINKCDVVCANCHRERSHQQRKAA